MSGSLKDAFEKSGTATGPVEDPKPKPDRKKWNEELSDDETLPPLFEKPALTKPVSSPPQTKPSTPPPSAPAKKK